MKLWKRFLPLISFSISSLIGFEDIDMCALLWLFLLLESLIWFGFVAFWDEHEDKNVFLSSSSLCSNYTVFCFVKLFYFHFLLQKIIVIVINGIDFIFCELLGKEVLFLLKHLLELGIENLKLPLWKKSFY